MLDMWQGLQQDWRLPCLCTSDDTLIKDMLWSCLRRSAIALLVLAVTWMQYGNMYLYCMYISTGLADPRVLE
jgi:hypothetical protein